MQSYFRCLILVTLMLVACDPEEDEVIVIKDPETEIPEDVNFETPLWSAESHDKGIPANYEVVFNQTSVGVLEITMDKKSWTEILDDGFKKLGYRFGSETFENTTIAPGNPIFVPVSVKFNGREWYKVGFRIKGNASLWNTWVEGIYKLPFRLDFDEFEDKYKQITDQRFYGFHELTMAPAVMDNSLIREKVAADIFRSAGVPAASTAYYRVYIDFGYGKKYCGVYTMVEVIEDTMLKDQFGEDHGNIYKPESNFSYFHEGEFHKKNNQNVNDYSDVSSFVETLNSPLRLEQPEQWRQQLESTFNIDHFIRWLAVNSVMGNWDSYGLLAHNYYLYNHSTKGLTWIPWDFNNALSTFEFLPQVTLSHSGVTGFPLVTSIMQDPVYEERYRNYIQEFVTNTFTTDKMDALFAAHQSLIAPYVAMEQAGYTNLSSPQAFSAELDILKQHVRNRLDMADEYLGG